MDREKYNTYMNDYMKRRYRQRRKLMFSILGDSCSKCGSIENLEADHTYWVDKEFNFSKYWNCALKKFLEELSKCQILCKSCHIEKSKVDFWDFNLDQDVPERSGKLTRDEVKDIRGFLSLGISHQDIANIYGVTRGTITHIANDRTWKE